LNNRFPLYQEKKINEALIEIKTKKTYIIKSISHFNFQFHSHSSSSSLRYFSSVQTQNLNKEEELVQNEKRRSRNSSKTAKTMVNLINFKPWSNGFSVGERGTSWESFDSFP
jgi:hypothetical protein